MTATIGAVVVNYNARDYLLACLASLQGQDLSSVVVVDNGSTDGSGQAVASNYPEVKWVASGGNIGYGRAANAGAALLDEDYLLVCNADIELVPGTVATLAAHLEADDHAGVAGPYITDADGALYPSARLFPDLVDAFGHGLLGHIWKANPYSRRYKMSDWDHAEPRAVDWVSGACFLVRRKAWDQVGGFDPAYFMYMEDVDLCWRMGMAGWLVAYQPAARVRHVQGVSADRHPYRMLAAHHMSMWRFAWRSTPTGRRWSLPVVLVGLAGRLGVLLTTKALARANPKRPKEARATPGGAAG